jgi:Protein of unknown function (DUF3606)
MVTTFLFRSIPFLRRSLSAFRRICNRWRNTASTFRVASGTKESEMEKKAKKKTARGRKQDRARVAGGQDYEVRYAAKKTGRLKAAVKKVVKKVGSSRKRVERRLGH